MPMENCTAPSGGPFDLSPEVSQVVLSHLELFAASERGGQHARLAKRRDKFLAHLTERDRAVLRVLGAAYTRLGAELVGGKAT
jgi:hypothetical protein